MRKFSTLLVALFVGSVSANAQCPNVFQGYPTIEADCDPTFSLIGGTPMPGIDNSSIAFIDYDGNSTQDLIITGVNNADQMQGKLYSNDGNGGFTLVGNPFVQVLGGEVAVADIDGDNDQDVLLNGSDWLGTRHSKLYRNNGNGTFTEIGAGTFLAVSGGTAKFADVDGDGDQDALITGYGQHGTWGNYAIMYTNDGTGTFTEVPGTPFTGVHNGHTEFADVDNDGDLDLLISGSGSTKLYLNDGAGAFTHDAANTFSGSTPPFSFADVDRDNDVDLIINQAGAATLYTNDAGSFTHVASTTFVGGDAILTEDFDNDNDIDVLMVGSNSTLYQNDGSGNFSTVVGTPFANLGNGSAAAADVNGDGDLDVVLTGVNGNRYTYLYTNSVSCTYTDVRETCTSIDWLDGATYNTNNNSATHSLVIGSCTYPVTLDLTIVSQMTATDVISACGQYTWVNGVTYTADNNTATHVVSGVGLTCDTLKTLNLTITGPTVGMTGLTLTGCTQGLMDLPNPELVGLRDGSMDFADVDGDGDPDLITNGNQASGSASKLYLNDGSGNYSLVAGTSFTGGSHGSVDFGDVDADGDQDVLICGAGSAILYLNDGNGAFSAHPTNTFLASARVSAMTDLDGDGDLDAIVFSNTSSKAYLNDGSGNMTVQSGEILATPLAELRIAVEDVNNDGLDDVFVTGLESSFIPTSKLFLNNGVGNHTFSESPSSFTDYAFGAIAIGDYSGDGLPDIFLSGAVNSSLESKFYYNQGSGYFYEDNVMASGSFLLGLTFSSAAFGDFDNDGDNDLLLTGDDDGGEARTYAFENNGGQFSSISSPILDIGSSAIKFADVDGNGLIDLLATGKNSSFQKTIKLYKNITTCNYTHTVQECDSYTWLNSTNYTSSNNTDTHTLVDGDGCTAVLTLDLTILNSSAGTDVVQACGTDYTWIDGITYTSNNNSATHTLVNAAGCDSVVTLNLTFDTPENIFPTVSETVQSAWTPATTQPNTGIGRGEAVLLDTDNDGDLDIVMSGRSSSAQTRIFRNNGGGSFSQGYNPMPNLRYSALAVADVDGNGHKDILITGQSGSTENVRLYKNSGTSLTWDAVNSNVFDEVYDGAHEFADVDGDGDQDVLITGRDASNNPIAKLYINTGGNFSLSTSTFSGVWDGSDLAFADVDGDNDLDVVIVGSPGNYVSANMYLNDGAGNFTDSGVTFTSAAGWGLYYREAGIDFADIDGDGDQDLLLTGEGPGGGRNSNLMLNDGSGNFTEIPGQPITPLKNCDVEFGDLDGDGDQDLLVSGSSNSGDVTKIYMNDGAGNFTENASAGLPGYSYTNVDIGDIDNDGDNDVLFGGSNNLRVYFNSQQTIYVDTRTACDTYTWIDGNTYTSNNSTATYTMSNGGGCSVDVTLDLTINNSTSGTDTRTECGHLLWIDGIIYTESNNTATQTILNSNGCDSVVTLDLTILDPTDSHASISVECVKEWNEVAATPFPGVDIGSVAFADTDNDGDMDVLVTGAPGQTDPPIAELYTNDGDGSYSLVAGTPFVGVRHSSVAFSDVDGDGTQDVLITGFDGSTRVTNLYRNEGANSFSLLAGNTFEGLNTSSVAFADVDNDLDPDLVIAGLNNSGLPDTRLYLNNGSGIFSEVIGAGIENVKQCAIAFADIDGDNDQDLLVTGHGASDIVAKLYRNNGGIFTEITGTPFQGVFFSSVAFSDVDGDNDLDVVIAGSTDGSNRITKLYWNNGSGEFTEDTGNSFTGADSGSIAFSDVDGDSDSDLLITGYTASFDQITKLYANDGSGGFTEMAGLPFTGVDRSSVALVDVNGDNTTDLLLTGWDGASRISKLYTNDIICTYTDSLEECPGYTWLDNNQYSADNNTATHTLTEGTCDIEVNLAFTVRTDNNWTGATSNEWSEPTNWCGGSVPGINDDVVINAGSVVEINSDPVSPIQIGNLTVDPGFTLVVTPGSALSVNGTMTNDGTVIVEADETEIGSFIDNGLAGSGSFQMEQYNSGSGGSTPDGFFWYVSSPVTDATSAVYNAGGTDRLWTSDEVAQAYPEITNNTTPLEVGKGYISRRGDDATIQFDGASYNTGTIVKSGLTRTGVTEVGRGYNLMGNPYPSSINWQIIQANSTNLLPTMWYRTKDANTMLIDTYNPVSDIGTNNNGNGAVDRYVPPTQAFWVRVDTDGNIGELTYNNGLRAHQDAALLRSASPSDFVKVSLGNGTVSDEHVVVFDPNATELYDAYDSDKLFGGAQPYLWSVVEGQDVTMNGVNNPSITPFVDLTYYAPEFGEYSINAVEFFTTGIPVILEDHMLGTFTDLEDIPQYTFTTEGGTFANRFTLHFTELITDLAETNGNAIRVYTNTEGLNVWLGDENAGSVRILDMAGRVVHLQNLVANRTLIQNSVASGVYLVEVVTTSDSFTQKIKL